MKFYTLFPKFFKHISDLNCYFVVYHNKMFKSFSHIVFSFLLLFATTGMAVSKHYCGDFLISTIFYANAESCCNSDSCCHNETAFYQLDEDFATPASSQIPQINDFELLVSTFKPSLEIFGDKIEKSSFAVRKLLPPPKIQTLLSLKQTWLL